MSRWSPARRRIIVGRNGDRGGLSGGDAQLGWSAPSGLSAGNSLIISTDGTHDFGSGPTLALFDDFSGSTIGAAINLSGPDVGEWVSRSSSSASITDADAHSGDRCFSVVDTTRSPDVVTIVAGVADAGGEHGLQEFQEIYFAYSVKDLDNFPGTAGTPTSFSTNSSTKDAWMMLGNRGDNTAYSVGTLGEIAGHDLYLPGWSGGDMIVAGNETGMSPSYYQSSMETNWAFGGWNTVMFHGKLNPVDPYGSATGFFRHCGTGGITTNTRSGNLMSDQVSEGVPNETWDRVKFGSYVLTTNPPVTRLYDDIYMALGANANAVVLVTDTNSFATAATVHHLRPTSWSASQVQVVIGRGMTSGTWHLWVSNASNVIAGPLAITMS